MKTPFLKLLFCSLFLLSISCINGQSQPTPDQTLPSPTLHYGNALLSGHIDTTLLDSFQRRSFILYAYNPFFNPFTFNRLVHAHYEITPDKDGSIHAVIPMFNEGIGALELSHETAPLFISLAPDQETVLHISLENGKIKTTGKNPFPIHSEDLANSFSFLHKHILSKRYSSTNPSLPAEARKETILENLTREQNKIDSLPFQGKQWITSENNVLKLVDLFDYSPKSSGNRSYYQFLQNFHLNDPYYLYSSNYGAFTNELLNDSILALPAIAENTVPEWQSEIKQSLHPLLGFDEGWFYDLLAASSYYQQLIRRKVFSETQKKNITEYFAATGLDRFLLPLNTELEKDLTTISPSKIVVCETPQVPDEEMLEKIIEKHKGKVIVMDFWATWCYPCMQAMKQLKTIKEELKGKDIVYIYLTNTSSPQKEWKACIQELEGEHYYLDQSTSYSIMERFENPRAAIPFYLIYDKNGTLKHQSIGFAGTEKMKEWIQECL